MAIDSDPEFLKKFVETAIEVDVVLACRVSPKQKADIVKQGWVEKQSRYLKTWKK